MEKIITTKDVHLYYGSKEALKGITLDFPDKGIHALMDHLVVGINVLKNFKSNE